MQVLLMAAVALAGFPNTDPAPSLFRGKAKSRELQCERMTVESAMRARPGLVFAAKPRGDYIERSVVLCKHAVLGSGLRALEDETTLMELQDRTLEIARSVASLRPDLADRVWMVEAFYPRPQVAAKLAFATKNALMGQGLSVSDRVPTLAAGDIDVITRMRPSEAYPAACERYAANGALGDQDALVAVIRRDPRETILHAGLCVGGQWSWLR